MSASLDAGPLIRLAEHGLLVHLRELFSLLVIPEAVFEEVVVAGERRGFGDDVVVRSAVDGGWLVVAEAREEAVRRVEAAEGEFGVELGTGERAALAVCLGGNADVVLTDDEGAYLVGRRLGLESRGTLFLLLRFVSRGLLDESEAVRLLGEMIEGGFWLSPRIVNDFHDALKRLREA